MEVDEIALAALVPPEKNDAVIYILPSLAAAFWIVSIFFVVTEPTQWLAMVGFIGSGITVILYLIPLDILLTRSILRYLVYKKEQMPKEKEFSLTINLLLQSWGILGWKKSEDWLEKSTRSYMTSTVSSYLVRQKSWLYRLTLYYYLAAIIFLGPLIASPLAPSVSIILPFKVQSTVLEIWWVWFIVGVISTIALIFPTVALWWRDYEGESKSFTRDIRYVGQFIYLQDLFGMDTVKRPQDYKDGTQKDTLRKELEFLHASLLRNDWSMFVSRWDKIRSVLNDEVTSRFDELYFPSVLDLWLELQKKEVPTTITQKQLEWLLYFAKQKPPKGIGKMIIDYLSPYVKDKKWDEIAKSESFVRFYNKLSEEKPEIKKTEIENLEGRFLKHGINLPEASSAQKRE